MVQRLTYRKRHPYNTRSNRVRKVKTPGGKLVFQQQKKPGSFTKCPVTGQVLHGLPARRSFDLKRIAKRHKGVSRPYGGHLSHTAVRERIIRAFLIEEQKIVKQVRKLQAKSRK